MFFLLRDSLGFVLSEFFHTGTHVCKVLYTKICTHEYLERGG